MKRSKKLILSSFLCHAAVIAAILLVMGGSVYAAARLLTPSEVAVLFEDEILSEAFASDNAKIVNETQTVGDYEITFLGMISGPGTSLTVSAMKENDLRRDVSNLVFAVNRVDGSEITDAEKWGVLNPININEWDIHESLPDYEYSNFSLRTGDEDPETAAYLRGAIVFGSRLSEDRKTVYMIYTCNNLEYLGDHELYIGIHGRDAVWLSSENHTENNNIAYYYDGENEIYVRNTHYNGINALFPIPVDPSRADPKMVQAIKEYHPELSAEEFQQIKDLFDPNKDTVILTKDNYQELATPVEGTHTILVPDEDGNVLIPGYKIYDPEGENVVMLGTDHTDSYYYYKNYLFKYSKPGHVYVNQISQVSGDNYKMRLYEVLTLNEDDSITYELYKTVY